MLLYIFDIYPVFITNSFCIICNVNIHVNILSVLYVTLYFSYFPPMWFIFSYHKVLISYAMLIFMLTYNLFYM